MAAPSGSLVRSRQRLPRVAPYAVIAAVLSVHAVAELPIVAPLLGQNRWIWGIWTLEVLLSAWLCIWLYEFARSRSERESGLERSRQQEEEIQRFSSTFAGDIVWQCDASSGRHIWSESTARVLGYDNSSALLAPDFWKSLIHPEDGPRVAEQVRAAIASGASTCCVEYRFKVADGSYREFLDRGAFIRDLDGKVLRAVGVMQDVTVLRAHERALSQSERRLRDLVEQSGALLYEMALDMGSILRIEGNASARLGYSHAQWMSPGFWQIVLHPEDRERALDFCAQKTAQAVDHEFQYRLIAADGSIVWIHDFANVTSDDQGRVVGLRGVMIDITRAKSLEAGRRLLFDSSLDMLCVASFDGAFLDVNPAWTATLGWSREEMLSRPWLDFVHPDDRARTVIAGQQVVEGKPLTSFRNRYQTKAGGYCLLSWSCSADAPRRLIFASARDITNLSRQARLLERTNATARIGGWEVDLESMSVFWTDEVYRIYGFEPGEVSLSIEQGINGYIPEHQDRVRRAVERSIASGERFDFEAQLLTKQGRVVWVQSIGQCETRNGKTLRIFGSIQDISERKAAEQALRESEDRHRMLLRQLPVGVMIHDGKTIRYANESMAGIFGIASADELVGANVLSLLPEEFWPLARSRCRRVLAGESSIPNDLFRIDRPDGSHVLCESACALIRLEGVPLIQTTFVDVTQTIRDREALERTNSLQAMLLRELDHRVKNSLMGLINLVDQTARHAENVGDFAVSIRSRLAAMAEVHALLSGGKWNPVPLRHLIDRLTPASLKGRMVLEGPDVQIPPRQATALAMVVQELLTNAVKHGAGSQPGGTIHVAWDVEATGGAQQVCMRWTEDSDAPLPAQIAERLGWGLIKGFTKSELLGEAELRLQERGVSHRLLFKLDAGTEDASPLPQDRGFAQAVMLARASVEDAAQAASSAIDANEQAPVLGAPAESGYIDPSIVEDKGPLTQADEHAAAPTVKPPAS